MRLSLRARITVMFVATVLGVGLAAVLMLQSPYVNLPRIL